MKYRFFIIFLFFCIIFQVFSTEKNEIYSLIQIHLNESNSLEFLQRLGLDPEGVSFKNNSATIILSESEQNMLKSKGIDFSVEIPDMSEYYVNRFTASNKKNDEMILGETNFKLGSFSGFLPLDSVYTNFKDMKTKYPKYFKKETIIGYSVEDRPIYCYTFGNTDDKSKPAVLFTGMHHAREPGGMMALDYFFWKILESADSGDSLANYLLSNRSIYVVPVVNPDGYFYNQVTNPQGGGLWRKNRRKVNDSTFGVDLNRNYGPYEYWNAPNSGSTDNPKDITYRGQSPFSEPEIQAIRDLCKTVPFKFAINYHSYSNLMIYPFSAINQQTPDSVYLRDFTSELARYNKYFQGTDYFTVGYSTRGNSDDYMYKPEAGKDKILALTFEIGNINDGFWPPANRILAHCRENYYPLEQILWSADVNIKPIELFSEFKSVSDSGYSCFANLKVKNFGLNESDSSSSLELKSLDSNIVFEESMRKIKKLKENEYESFSFVVDIIHNNFSNGTSIPVVCEIFQENVIRRDTFSLQLYSYKPKVIFSQGKLSGSWNMGLWGTVFDSTFGEFVLNDSPKGLYKDSSTNYMTMDKPLHLDNFPVSLEFLARWETEPHYDAGFLQISSDNGKNWAYLKTDRMVDYYGLADSRFVSGSSGFSGYMPVWFRQECSLNKYAGKDIILRFGLLCDKRRNFDGLFLKDIVLKVFDDAKYTGIVKLDDFTSVKIFPNPVFSGSQIKIEIAPGFNRFFSIDNVGYDCEVVIRNILGSEVYKKESYIGLKEKFTYYLPTNIFPAGCYFAEIKLDNKIYRDSFIIIGK